MRDLYIIGAGGFGREVAWLIERINNIESTWNLQGFIDDDDAKWNNYEGKYKVWGGCDYLQGKDNVYVICAVGNAIVRKNIINKLKQMNVKFATVIDPSVIMSETVEIGEGTIICAGSIITVDVKIGEHVIINLDCTIGHDDIIDNYVTIYPSVNVSGNVHVGECCEIGTGAQVIQGKDITKQTVLGAGAVVIREINESGTYVGSPAKKVK